MKKTKLLPLLLLITLILPSNSFAYNKKGEYVTGGGVGSISCSMYLPLLYRADLAGGLNSEGGIIIINAYMNYVLGFQTGYNSSHLGKRDIFAQFGDAPTNEILPLIAKWCKENPDKTFGNGVVAIAKQAAESNYDENKEPEPKKKENIFGF